MNTKINYGKDSACVRQIKYAAQDLESAMSARSVEFKTEKLNDAIYWLTLAQKSLEEEVMPCE